MLTIDLKNTKRTMTDAGFLRIEDCVLARSGIQEYRAFELELTDRDPLAIVRVYRPESEVFNARSMASFEDHPVTVNHPTVDVSADNWKEYSAGHVRDVRREGDLLMGTIIISDKTAIKALDGGKNELSNGYFAEYRLEAGRTPEGELYDAVQTNIRGNHVALVDAARCGSACRVSDSQPTKTGVMMADAKRKVTVDGITLEVEETSASLIEKLIKDRDGLSAKVVTLSDAAFVEVKGAKMSTKDAGELITTLTTKVDELSKDVFTPDQRDALVADWATMSADAVRLVPGFDVKGKTCAAVRREVVGKLITGDSKATIEAIVGPSVEKASDDAIRTAFKVAASMAPVAAVVVQDALGAALSNDANVQQGGEVQLSGRDKYLHDAANAWQTK